MSSFLAVKKNVNTGEVAGFYDPQFERVAEEFVRNFQERGEVGAAVSIIIEGEKVVDLWGGSADPASNKPWVEDTLTLVWSATKGATALCAHMLASRGLLDLDAPVARYWPEFGQAGKEAIPVKMLLNHQSGLAAIREPLVRRDDRWLSVSWEDAFAEIERGLMPLLQEGGRDALAIYIGNPNAHNLASLLYLPVFLQAARTHNVFSASTLDQMPKHVSAGLMFGTVLSIPVPDLERTDYLLLLGANPLVSNGSLMTAPDMRGRLRRLRQRGGKVVVIDPYRTRTAQEADE